MRRTRSDETLSTAFSARIEAVEALNGVAVDAERLRATLTGLRTAGQSYNGPSNTHTYEMLADLIEVSALLVDWREAVLNATPDSDRFLRAAKAKSRQWRSSQSAQSAPLGFRDFTDGVDVLSDTDHVAPLIRGLAAVPLPLGVFVHQDARPASWTNAQSGEAPEKLVVAFLKFSIDGAPASEVHFVQPHEVHDLDIEVRVSFWPEGAEALELRPVSAEPSSIYELPVFMIAAPSNGAPPFVFRERGRAVIKAPQSLRASPFEFRYAAEFLPRDATTSVWAEGHRTLRLEAVDWRKNPLTGYPNVDQRIVFIRDQLRSAPGLPDEDIANAVRVLVSLGNLAGQAAQDALFAARVQEDEFHREVRRWLRAQPDIGSELEEHPHAAGGITDLSFRGIRLELKAETEKIMSLADCNAYTAQAASYAVGSGKRIAILCVLSSAPKPSAPFAVEDGIGVLVTKPDQSEIFIPTIIVQGGLAKPSSLRGR